MDNNINLSLLEKFTYKSLEWRVQQASIYNGKPTVIVVPYLKSRAIKDRLDKIFGWENWSTKFIPIEKGFICELTIDINGKKVTKSDGAQYTNIEAIKGGMSDAFKRAAKMLGIGRYLDGCGIIYAACSLTKTSVYTEYTKTKDGKVIFWAKPTPKEEQQPVQQQQQQPVSNQQQQPAPTPAQTPTPTRQQQNNTNDYTITDPQLKRLYAIAKKYNWTEEDIKEYIKVEFDLDSKKDLIKSQYDKLIAHIENDNRGEIQDAQDDDEFLPMPVNNNYYAQSAK